MGYMVGNRRLFFNYSLNAIGKTLKEQCEWLEIELKKKGTRSLKNSAEKALQLLKQEGFDGVDDEGYSIKRAVQAVCVNKMAELSDNSQGELLRLVKTSQEVYGINKTWVTHKEICLSSYYPQIRWIKGGKKTPLEAMGQIIESAKTISRDDFIDNYMKLWPQHSSADKLYPLPKPNKKLGLKIYDILSPKRLAEIAEVMFLVEKFYIGWPDLTIFKNNELHLVEVKGGKDKFRENQLKTIKKLKEIINHDNIKIYCLHLLKRKLRYVVKKNPLLGEKKNQLIVRKSAVIFVIFSNKDNFDSRILVRLLLTIAFPSP